MTIHHVEIKQNNSTRRKLLSAPKNVDYSSRPSISKIFIALKCFKVFKASQFQMNNQKANFIKIGLRVTWCDWNVAGIPQMSDLGPISWRSRKPSKNKGRTLFFPHQYRCRDVFQDSKIGLFSKMTFRKVPFSYHPCAPIIPSKFLHSVVVLNNRRAWKMCVSGGRWGLQERCQEGCRNGGYS